MKIKLCTLAMAGMLLAPGSLLASVNSGGGFDGTQFQVTILDNLNDGVTPVTTYVLQDVLSILVRQNAPGLPGTTNTLTITKLGDDSPMVAAIKNDLANAPGGQIDAQVTFMQADGSTRNLKLLKVTAIRGREHDGEDGDFDDLDDFQQENLTLTFTTIDQSPFKQ